MCKPVCPAGWQSFGGSCYWMVSNINLLTTWHEAFTKCSAIGAHLLIINSIHTQEEEEFLALYSKGTTKWIGLRSNPIEGGYSWSDGTPLSHTNWGNGEPNNHEGREDCVEMVSNANGTYSLWNDLNCDAHQDWICKITKGKDPILPPRPPSPEPGN
uniref:C-type lectin domain-containing protein n=1 Tax=Pundamilia nyererei TaxID=303518 RepID=A0A3B4FI60_9CICH